MPVLFNRQRALRGMGDHNARGRRWLPVKRWIAELIGSEMLPGDLCQRVRGRIGAEIVEPVLLGEAIEPALLGYLVLGVVL